MGQGRRSTLEEDASDVLARDSECEQLNSSEQ